MRYFTQQSRSGFHNMYKEFRNTSMNGAVDSLYLELASRHRVRASGVQIVKTAIIPSNKCIREAITMMHVSAAYLFLRPKSETQ
jgi:large subunit ribosomal protein L18Ae